MNVVVIGCGKFGAYLIEALSKTANPPHIIAIDRNEKAFDRLPVEYRGFTMARDASDLTVLDDAKVNRADAVFLATDDSNLNFMLAHVINALYNTSNVMVAESDEEKKQILKAFDIAAINPLEFAALEIVTRLGSKRGDQS